MSDPYPPTVPFAHGAIWPHHVRRSTSRVPTQLRIGEYVREEEFTDATPHSGSTIRLRPTGEPLANFVARELAELLLSVPGVRPDTWAGPDRWVDVPVAEPTTITDDQLTWHVTSELAVHHTDHVGAYFSLTTADAASALAHQGHVDLTLPECTQLVIALASVQYWLFELGTNFNATPTAKRRGLQRARTMRGIRGR